MKLKRLRIRRRSRKPTILISSLLFFFLGTVGCSPSRTSLLCQPPSTFSYTGPQHPFSIYITAHGLNNPPEVMNDLIQELHSEQQGVINVQLRGHEGSRCVPSAKDWENDIDTAFVQAHNLCPECPIGVVGFSTGGAALIRYLDTHTMSQVKGALFFAPALVLKWYSGFLLPLLPLASFDLPAFSLAPQRYRLYMFPPFALYRALFQLQGLTWRLSHSENLERLHPIIFLGKGDELVSASGIEQWLRQNNITSASVKILSPNGPEKSWRHLIIGKEVVGTLGWNQIRQAISLLKSEIEPHTEK